MHIDEGRIARVADYDDVPAGASVTDYGEHVIMPGLVDSHVHVNEPGRTEWEGFETATRAAAAGGVTTIVDMPLNSIPPTTTVQALMAKAEAMEGKCHVDVALWGGAVPGNAPLLGDMLRHGARGFKCFLIESGVPEFGFLDAAGLEEALVALRDTGAPLLVHAELPGPIDAAREHLSGDHRSYRRYVASRPPAAEDQAIERVARFCTSTGARAHIVHLSSSGGLDILRRARDQGTRLTAETTPHYLHFAAESIPDGAPEFKCAPPIRERDNRERLWDAVREELLAGIVSDHSPCTPELKKLQQGDVEHAWGGIASLQFGLSIVWTNARERGVPLEALPPLLCQGPARIAGLEGRKGSLERGADADLVVWAPEESFRVTPDIVQHRHTVTPYTGAELFGAVKATFVRGVKVWEDGQRVGGATGRWIQA